jgi:cytoskeletal protein RodZ
MARAVHSRVEGKPPRVDPDATAQLERPPGTKGAPPSRPVAARGQADRWSTVFTVFAAVALVALLLLGAAVISSQQVAAPSASPSTSPSPSSSASPSISLTPVAPTAKATPTEVPPSLTPVPTRTLPLTPVPTILPSLPVTPLPTRT